MKKKGRTFYAQRKGADEYFHKVYECIDIVKQVKNDLFDKIDYCIEEALKKTYTRRAYAYLKNTSISKCANVHKKARFVYKCDVKSFFESITEEQIKKSLLDLGIDNKMAIIIAKISTYDGKLRLGSKNSPHLSNIVAGNIDRDVDKLLRKMKYWRYRIKYTRYSDDLIFSSRSRRHFDWKIFTDEIQEIFEMHGFKMNQKKVHFLTNKYRMNVLGVNLNDNGFSVSKKYRNRLRMKIYELKWIDKENNAKIYKQKLNSIIGKINYIWSVNKKQAIVMKNYLNTIIAKK